MQSAVKKSALAIFHALRLKRLPRTGWLEAMELPESVADHSFGASFIALVLSRMEKLDKKEEAALLSSVLLHDLHEALTGDLSLRQKSYVSADYKKAKSDILSGTFLAKDPHLPLQPKIMQLCHDADRLDLLFQALIYRQLGKKTDSFIKTALSELKSASARRLAREAVALSETIGP
ncbi:MAG: HD domain-containing protein [Candidatus Micrarchaeota archaeon]|nr:HD domain-containing protein [Candidatus Micrarchaeota archaeon]